MLTKMFQDLNINSDIFNSLEMISASDVNAQMNKSVIADVGDFPLWNRALCIGTLQRGKYITRFDRIYDKLKAAVL